MPFLLYLPHKRANISSNTFVSLKNCSASNKTIMVSSCVYFHVISFYLRFFQSFAHVFPAFFVARLFSGFAEIRKRTQSKLHTTLLCHNLLSFICIATLSFISKYKYAFSSIFSLHSTQLHTYLLYNESNLYKSHV